MTRTGSPRIGSRRCWGVRSGAKTGSGCPSFRAALRISPNDAVWDVMIALDYHLQLYDAVPKENARETDKAVVELCGLVDAVRR
jgi:hypothetical protein